MTSRPDAMVVAASAPLAAAFERLRETGYGLLAVVDGERFAGTITDADVRRAALRDPSLSSPVADALSDEPCRVGTAADDEEVARVLRERAVRAVAVVDGAGLAGVRTHDGLPSAQLPAPVAVVMVGGRGERLRPWTDKVPKPLLRVGGHPIVERIVMSLAAGGVRKVYLAVNYMSELFEERLGDGGGLGVDIHYVRDPEGDPLGSAGALSLLPERPSSPLVVTNGDLVTTVDFAAMVDFHRQLGATLTVAGVEHRTPIPYGVLRTDGHRLLAIEEKPDRVDFVNAGMYVLDPAALAHVAPGTPMGMDELIGALTEAGLAVHVFPVLEQWYDVGTPDELERVLIAFATGEEQ